ncbi:putative sugar kinase [uncultured archaeon]|nr:putative sugar kinase [uncultured archaeon]
MMDKKYQVVGFGALNWDDIREVNEIVRPGGETSGEVLLASPGGSAANTIVGLSRLGVSTAFVGAIGNDEIGKRIVNDLEKEKVEQMIVSKKGYTGNCTVLVDNKGERSIYVFPEVNDTISIKDIPESTIKVIKEVGYFYSATFACRSYESLETQLKLSKIAQKFVFSPGTLYTNPDSKVVQEKNEVIDALLDNTDILFLNHEEIKMRTGQSEYSRASKKLMETYDNIGTIAVTLGENGCFVKTRTDEIKIPAYKAEIIKDTVGAGDSFAAGFMYGLIKGKSPKTCGEIGNYVANKVIGKAGAREGLPSHDDAHIEKLLSQI